MIRQLPNERNQSWNSPICVIPKQMDAEHLLDMRECNKKFYEIKILLLSKHQTEFH